MTRFRNRRRQGRRRRSELLLLAAGCWLTVACEADRPDQVFEIDGLTVDAYFTDPVCGGTLGYFDRRLRWLEEQTGLRAADKPLRFVWYREEVPDSCRTGAEGCTRGSTSYGPLLLFSHELVHGLLSQLGDVRPWLGEGLAVLLEDDLADPPSDPTAPSSLLDVAHPSELDYFASGAFVAYLRQRYGLAQLLDFYRAVDGADPAATREAFEDVFGDSWDAIEDDYLQNYDPGTLLGFLDCEAPSVAWVDQVRWEHRFTDGCEGEHSIGPFDLPPAGTEPDPWFEDAVTLRVTTPGPYRVETTGIASATIVVRSCISPGAIVLWSDEPASGYQWFDRGQVRVTLRAPLDVVPDVQVRLVRYPDLLDGG